MKYKDRYTLDQRKTELQRIRKKYPDRIPVILQKSPESRLPVIKQSKFLVPDTITLGELLIVIKKRITLEPHQALFLFLHKTVPTMSSTIKNLYDLYKDEDGFLYIEYTEEHTFG